MRYYIFLDKTTMRKLTSSTTNSQNSTTLEVAVMTKKPAIDSKRNTNEKCLDNMPGLLNNGSICQNTSGNVKKLRDPAISHV